MFPGCSSGEYLRVAPSDYAFGSASGRLTGRAFLPSTLRPACCLPRSGLDAKIRFFRIASSSLPGKRGASDSLRPSCRAHATALAGSARCAAPVRQSRPAPPIEPCPCTSPCRLCPLCRTRATVSLSSARLAAPVRQSRPVLPRPCDSPVQTRPSCREPVSAPSLPGRLRCCTLVTGGCSDGILPGNRS